MSVLAPSRPPAQASPQPDPDALIKEARERQRRRRLRAGIALALLAGLGTTVGVVWDWGGGTPAVVRIAGGPTVNVRGFGGQGRLAFVSRNSLWVLDGDRSSLRQVAMLRGLHPEGPVF